MSIRRPLTKDPSVSGEKRRFARELRGRMTRAEEVFWNLVRRDRTGLRFRRQHVIEGYIADFLCTEVLVAIEFDGEIHEHHREEDERRDSVIRDRGIEVIRVPNAVMEQEPEATVNRIVAACNQRIAVIRR